MVTLRRFWNDEQGTETVEWALILGVIILAAIVAAGTAKTSMQTIFGKLNTELGTAAQ